MPITTVVDAPVNSAPPTSARERAIAAMMKSSPGQETPPVDASNVSAEEISAVAETRQNNVAEATTPETPATAPEATPLSPQLAQLARKERQIRAEAQKLKAEREAFKAEQAALRPKTPEFDQNQYIPKERLTKDALSVLNELGVTYDQITQQAMSAPSSEQIALNQTINELRAELKSVKDAQEGTKKSWEESQQASYKQALNQIRNETKNLVNSDPEAFEVLRSSGAVDDVVELIEKTFHADGILMTVEDAAQAVEDYLVDEASKYAKLKKVQQKLKPAAGTPATNPQSQSASNKQGQKQQPAKTLTNAVGTQRQLSSRERAILAFKGELKQ